MSHRQHRFPRVRASVQAVSISLGLSLVVAAPNVLAQSNATSTIYGSVPVGEGTQVVLVNTATGVARTIRPDANGRYRATSLPPGNYQVKVVRGDAVLSTIYVVAKVGSGVDASYAGDGSGAVQMDAVKVVGSAAREIDVTTTNNGVVLTATELARLPVANDIASVVQLTPGAIQGTNGQYGNAPSIGGAGQSENSFYVNGFPITNILTQVGSAELPFGAIADMQVLTGGYGAEFGRSTGGVINVSTKSGGNEFKGGAKISWSPDSLRSDARDTYWPNTGSHPDTDGKLYSYAGDNTRDSRKLGVYLGGPIIKDRLFFFLSAEQTLTNSGSVSATTNSSPTGTGWSRSKSVVNRFLGKIDFNLTDDHRFEFTKLYDRTTTDTTGFRYNYTNFNPTTQVGLTQRYINCCDSATAPGADISILKYTGYLTENLTVTALYGDSRTEHERIPAGYNPSLAQVSAPLTARVPGLNYVTPQTVTGSLPAPGSMDGQKGGRFDIEYRLGKHSLRAGIDRMDIDTVVGNSLAGGSSWSYQKAADPNRPIAGAFQTPAQGGGYGAQGYYVTQSVSTNVARPSSVQSAQYLQDLWQVSDRLLLSLGLRREQFTNKTSDGDAFIEQKNMLAPRLGVTWDYHGDGSLKLFANAGRYHLPVPSNLSSNMASPLLITTQYFTYSGVDQVTGLPTGLHPISDVYSANGFYGVARDAKEVTSIDIDPLSQDEASFGFEQALSDSYVVGASFTYRHLNQTNDDTCDQRPIDAWAERNQVSIPTSWHFACAIINPGRRNDLWIDFGDGKGSRRVDLSAEDWGIPKAHRIYRALNLFAEHPFDGRWYGRIDYTLSALKGNMEGQTDTIGGGSVALTVSSDHGELMYYANGYLPGDRRHAVKAYGYFQATPEWRFGANLAALSGAPRNCIGEMPDLADWDGNYGSAYFYCNGQPSPRGSMGRLDWRTKLDANVTYMPRFAPGLSVSVDVFNVFDSTPVTRYNENREGEGTVNVNRSYLMVAGRQEPRSVRLNVEYNW